MLTSGKTFVPLCAAALLLAAGPADAADTVAVLGLEPINTSETNANALSDALRAGIRETAGVKLVPSKDYVEVKFLFNCMDRAPASIPLCLVPAGKSLGVDKVIIGSITGRAKGKRIDVSLKLVESRTQTILKTIEEEVASGDLIGSGNPGRWVSILFAAREERPAQLEITSEPSDAAITLDGMGAGRTPATLTVSGAGKHTIVVGKEGFGAETRTVHVNEGETARVAVTFQGGAPPSVAVVETPSHGPPSAASEHPGRTPKIFAGAALVVAVVGAGIAIYSWRHYADLETTTNSTLSTLHDGIRGSPNGADLEYFFGKDAAGRAARSDCKLPSGLAASDTSRRYVDQCNEGVSYANATTGLWVGAGVLAAVAAVSFGVGQVQSQKVPPQNEGGAKPQATRPRLRLVSPVVSAEGGGVTAAFEF
ncbi:MAG: PEGA domain-containing protein [Myxococcales bacterium]|nr:PEGA domain-containing protein [Myxococcales bacterium]